MLPVLFPVSRLVQHMRLIIKNTSRKLAMKIDNQRIAYNEW